ncbi:MAG: hypothetical protein RBU29_13085, partial [bacterium]|nr:hypothetical protein [bacterium]
MIKQSLLVVLISLFVVSLVQAQYGTFSKDERILYTAENPYERFEDGRPKVPDSILERMKEVSIEEAWGVLR